MSAPMSLLLRLLTLFAALHGFCAVGAGAFGAHALVERLAGRPLQVWQTASHYQALHAAALLGLVALQQTGGGRALACAGLCFAVGAALFSGSLYWLALGGPRWLGPVTPLGGTLLLVGWGALAVHAASR